MNSAEIEEALRDREGATVRRCLRRACEALEAGRALDSQDAAVLAAALRALDAGWPAAPRNRADAFGRAFLRAFGLSRKAGRKSARSIKETERQHARARDVIALMAGGSTYEAACSTVAKCKPVTSEATVRRAYRDHRRIIERMQAMSEHMQAEGERVRAAFAPTLAAVESTHAHLARALDSVKNRR